MKKYIIAVVTLTLVFTLSINIACSNAEFELSSLEISSSKVGAGDIATITVDVKNSGTAAGTYDVVLMVDEATADTMKVSLQVGESKKVTFSLVKDDIGTYTVEVGELSATLNVVKPAEFQVGELSISPVKTICGEPSTVTVDVQNIGDCEGTFSAALMIDGMQEEKKETILAPGEKETVSFRITRETSGTYRVGINDLTGNLEVLNAFEIVSRAYAAMEDYQNLQFDMLMEMEMSSEADGELEEVYMVTEIEMAADYEAQEVMMIYGMQTEVPGQAAEEMNVEMYLVDDIAYMNMEAPGEVIGWQREEAEPEIWDTFFAMRDQMSMELSLEDAEVNLAGTEMVEGTECYVFDVLLTEEAFLDALQSQMQMGILDGAETMNFDEMFAVSLVFQAMDIYVQEWIAVDGCYLKKVEMSMELDMKPLMYMKIDIFANYQDPNEPVVIELPQEAAVTPEAQEVIFPDENLAVAIRDVLGKTTGEKITTAELSGLTILLAEESEISNLSGLEYCTGLTWLSLWENQIIDISPLENLTNLKTLWLDANQISDISPLEKLTKLTELGLSNNKVSDISPLEKLTKLTDLGLWNNQISDISALRNLTKLTDLSIRDNQIIDISPLENLTGLTSLSLRINRIADISPLSNLTNLTDLYLGANQIDDISPLKYMTSLTKVWLYENQISDISPLVENYGLGVGDEIWLEDNALDLTEGSDDMENIRALEDRGVIIHCLGNYVEN